jgi:uncharacterized protein (TIGR03437 family)
MRLHEFFNGCCARLFGLKFARILLVRTDPSLVALAIIGCCTAHAQTYGISTFAGGAPPTAVPATSTSASEPQAVAVDAVGDVFFADFYSDIMRVDAVTGQLTVVAGNGTPGFSGDDGLATNAQLNQPAGIAVDLAGNLYIADTLNNRVRRVSHGVIATIAGDGTTAVMNMPLGIAVDISGNVYVADSGNNRVLEISQGSIATVATLSPTIGCAGVAVSPNGTLYVSTSVNVYQMNDGLLVRVSQSPPPAKFEPVGIAVDANGRVYVADVGNHEIWQISNGTMTVVAGNGASGYSGDNGPATLAELNWAEWVAVDAADNLYIADSMNNRIRKVTLGVITTIAGGYGTAGPESNGRPTTSAQLNLPQGIATDAAGNVYIADTGSNRVFEVSHGARGIVAGNGTAGFSGDGGAATSAQLNQPEGVAVDGFGNVYITDSLNHRIRKVTQGVITTVAGNGTLGFSGDGGPATAAQLSVPQGGLAIDADGNLYIADTFNWRIREVSNGVITTVTGNGGFYFSGDGGPAIDASLNGPVGVAIDSQNNLYIADTGYPDGAGRIRKVSNGVITTVAGGGRVLPGNLGDNGPATRAVLSFPKSIAVDSAGNLYIADAGSSAPVAGAGAYARVRKVSNGVITTIAGAGPAGFGGDNGPASAAALNVPQSVAVDGAGNVYVADSGSAALVSNGNALALHLLDTGNNRIRVLTPNPVPSILPGGIVPNDGSVSVIQAGSWISIYGSFLANGTYLWNGDFPISLGGTSVTIDGKPAYLWFVSPTQINAQAPDDTATGMVSVVITTPFGTASSTVTLAPYGPSFSLLDDGKHVAGEIVSQNGTGAYDLGYYDLVGPANTFSFATRPVKPGEMLSLFGVGFGPTTPHVPAGVTFSGAAPTGGPVTIMIGGVTARVIFEGLTAAGLFQFNVIVPNAPSGDQALQATVNGVQTASGPVVTIQ